MTSHSFAVVELHEHPELLLSCCELLNDEWKRSLVARMRTLEKSSHLLPVSLLLVEKNAQGEIEDVVGHSRICQVALHQWSCFIESVVIQKKRRGQGLGKLLMQETEIYAKSLGFTTAYLTTWDKQTFYEHIGYHFCEPVEVVKNSWSESIVNRLCEKAGNSQAGVTSGMTPYEPSPSVITGSENCSEESGTRCGGMPPLPPPLPLPPQSMPYIKPISRFNPEWMKKQL